jgi:hypothetical protein
MALNRKWLMCNLKKTVLVETQGRFFIGRFVSDAGAVFYWAFGGEMKSKSPRPPFKKGGEKAPDFFNSKRYPSGRKRSSIIQK